MNIETLWDGMHPACRSIITSRCAFGLRSDAGRAWQDIPEDRRACYKANIKPSDYDTTKQGGRA